MYLLGHSRTMGTRTLFFSVFLMLFLPAQFLFGITLVSRSNGLGIPIKEEGRTEMETADMNRDGNLDLVSVGDHGSPYINSDEHGIMVWLGDGLGNWSVEQTGNFGYGGCAAGDLDLDGWPDLAWGIHHNYGPAGFGDTLMGAALNNGSGGWIPWATGLASSGETWGMFTTALADFDCNGLLDVLSQSFGGSNGLRLYQNNGDGTWNQVWAQTGGSVIFTMETGEFNGDGYPDFVCTRGGSNVYQGDGAFGFTQVTNGLPAGTIRGVDFGDMNNDGRDDLVFALGSSGLRCYTYDLPSTNWISAAAGLPTGGTYALSQFGDLDGDGLLDIVAYAGPQGVVYLGDGEGHWTADATWTMPSPGDASALRVDGEVDHDGREDIVIQADKSGFPFYRNQLRLYSPWQEPTELTARVTRPRGGETWRAGSIQDIRWLAAVPPAQGAATVEIQLSTSGPEGPWVVLASGLPDNGRFQWLVDPTVSSTSCRVKVLVTTDPDSVSALSAENFTIAGGVVETVEVELICFPHSGVLPFTTWCNVSLTNESTTSGRLMAGWIDILTAGGASLQHWRSGVITLLPGEVLDAGFSKMIPALPTTTGDNLMTFNGMDITPAPYNQPPYAPSGDTDSAQCLIEGL